MNLVSGNKTSEFGQKWMCLYPRNSASRRLFTIDGLLSTQWLPLSLQRAISEFPYIPLLSFFNHQAAYPKSYEYPTQWDGRDRYLLLRPIRELINPQNGVLVPRTQRKTLRKDWPNCIEMRGAYWCRSYLIRMLEQYTWEESCSGRISTLLL